MTLLIFEVFKRADIRVSKMIIRAKLIPIKYLNLKSLPPSEDIEVMFLVPHRVKILLDIVSLVGLIAELEDDVRIRLASEVHRHQVSRLNYINNKHGVIIEAHFVFRPRELFLLLHDALLTEILLLFSLKLKLYKAVFDVLLLEEVAIHEFINGDNAVAVNIHLHEDLLCKGGIHAAFGLLAKELHHLIACNVSIAVNVNLCKLCSKLIHHTFLLPFLCEITRECICSTLLL